MKKCFYFTYNFINNDEYGHITINTMALRLIWGSRSEMWAGKSGFLTSNTATAPQRIMSLELVFKELFMLSTHLKQRLFIIDIVYYSLSSYMGTLRFFF